MTADFVLQFLCYQIIVTVMIVTEYLRRCTNNLPDGWPMTRYSFPAWARDVFVLHGIRTVFDSHPPSCPEESEKSLPRNKAAGHESDHLLPSSSTVKNAWICASTPPYALIVWRFIKHWDNFVVTH